MSTRALIAAAIAASFVTVVACSERGDVFVGADCASGFCDDGLIVADADAGADAVPATTLLACIGTQCPPNFATCSAAEKCAVDLMNDPLNCGACGVVCPSAPGVAMASSCIAGKCVYHCAGGWARLANCNGLLDDGCEADIDKDPKNCGGCGIQCAPGEPCIEGICGCMYPKVPCNGQCVDLASDDNNCGACGAACQAVENGCSPLPANMGYGCLDSACARLKCTGAWGDCDKDSGCGSNGCETPLDTDDNCGKCGNKCGADQTCLDRLGGIYECVDRCEKSGRIDCGAAGNAERCRDITIDVKHCGGCKRACTEAGPNQVDKCDKGVCTVECKTGFADCNGEPSDGCEVDLTTNAANCGTCGNSCELGAGQPCVAGKCLMVECDAGAVTK